MVKKESCQVICGICLIAKRKPYAPTGYLQGRLGRGYLSGDLTVQVLKFPYVLEVRSRVPKRILPARPS